MTAGGSSGSYMNFGMEIPSHAHAERQGDIQKLAKMTEEFLNDNVRISYSEMDLVRFAKHLIAHGVTFKEDSDV